MILVLSGEGPTDLGRCHHSSELCQGDAFAFGPLGLIAEQWIAQHTGVSLRASPELIHFVPKQQLGNKIRSLPLRLQPARSKKKAAETGYFFSNAMALGLFALDLERQTGHRAVAILHRDCDSTHSAKTGMWEVKQKSMLDGFTYARFERGVPMLPKPTSEVWLLCAAKQQPYQRCEQLEDLPGNLASPHHPKYKLDEVFGQRQSAEQLCNWLDAHPFDSPRARAMPSYAAFHDRLLEAIRGVLH
ncbi:MAG: hypothetical protein Q8M09_00415 [Pseudomonadota bacterium]|nr:hypothetical protein [Pseudomonadota bacterium]MDP1902708.1 hypothetical protein [Pseudomonadota bacterium]MDP2351030.1 hypothetical protein [Pseudomonadota bacterium]